MRPSSGGAKTVFKPPRTISSDDIALPSGYQIEPIVTGLTFPTGIAFDTVGQLYVVESGYSYGEVWTAPKLLRIEANNTFTPIAVGSTNGPWTGISFNQGKFYIAEGGVLAGGQILQISANGQIRPIVSKLPSYGDHHTDGPVIGPDGWIYFGQGTASNSGVVGPDNARFGWLKRRPQFHDIPAQDIILAGQNFSSDNPLTENEKDKATTGAFSEFGSATRKGQVIKGQIMCGGAIMRVKPEGTDLEVVAWGFRNPFGLAFAPDGKLYVTENGYDDRGNRPIWGAPDVLWQVSAGVWYGWPDFAAGDPVTRPQFKPPGKPQPQFLLAKHPNIPPRPIARFGVHSSANGLDFSRNEAFGHAGEAFVALFGDQSPGTGKLLHPVGFKVVRVDTNSGTIHDFVVNKGRQNGPASKIGGGGLERPVAVRFNPSGDALFIVDFGIMTHSGGKDHPYEGTGVIWKVTRSSKSNDDQ